MGRFRRARRRSPCSCTRAARRCSAALSTQPPCSPVPARRRRARGRCAAHADRLFDGRAGAHVRPGALQDGRRAGDDGQRHRGLRAVGRRAAARGAGGRRRAAAAGAGASGASGVIASGAVRVRIRAEFAALAAHRPAEHHHHHRLAHDGARSVAARAHYSRDDARAADDPNPCVSDEAWTRPSGSRTRTSAASCAAARRRRRVRPAARRRPCTSRR